MGRLGRLLAAPVPERLMERYRDDYPHLYLKIWLLVPDYLVTCTWLPGGNMRGGGRGCAIEGECGCGCGCGCGGAYGGDNQELFLKNGNELEFFCLRPS